MTAPMNTTPKIIPPLISVFNLFTNALSDNKISKKKPFEKSGRGKKSHKWPSRNKKPTEIPITSDPAICEKTIMVCR